ncbi:hypothetical protein TPSD3_01630 [Thioflexithrix psekupsensis]|uniref:Sulfatase-modifying factor enzyme-like domain-containing protein n=1 Tax=Thioflexithrix psekupsensis TaxID=1570016 RepID=A0A251XBR7_9GAMM|nr:hypothetical protein TPSD3_01630 [Thioflexithrix psekupsensis]
MAANSVQKNPSISIFTPKSGDTFQDKLKDGSLAPEMVIVPAGKFMMGSNDDNNEKPIHDVTITKPFALGKYQVTFEDYDKYCKATGTSKPNDNGWGRGKRPVINVSWNDAQKYCQWLSQQTGEAYRLPTEAEWEYACRAGTTTRYWWGDEIGKNKANCDGCGSRWGNQQTAPVGSFKPNPFGLYDMHGNVWEWCQDGWHGDYKGAPTDGSAWEGGDGMRVLRGGSWSNLPSNLRSALRSRNSPDYSFYNLGFRVVRSSPSIL